MAKKRIFKDDDSIINMCPYSYYSCLGVGLCPVKEEIASNPSSVEHWKKSASKATSCIRIGERLSRVQYENKKIGKLL